VASIFKINGLGEFEKRVRGRKIAPRTPRDFGWQDQRRLISVERLIIVG